MSNRDRHFDKVRDAMSEVRSALLAKYCANEKPSLDLAKGISESAIEEALKEHQDFPAVAIGIMADIGKSLLHSIEFRKRPVDAALMDALTSRLPNEITSDEWKGMVTYAGYIPRNGPCETVLLESCIELVYGICKKKRGPLTGDKRQTLQVALDRFAEKGNWLENLETIIHINDMKAQAKGGMVLAFRPLARVLGMGWKPLSA